MKENKRIEKELLFKNNIKDITSISIDSEHKIKEQELIGSFIISGDYKVHEVSLNREKFNFKIPFKHEIENDIDLNTINVEITNFEYDYNKDELIVNIEYDINADRKDVLIFDNEESLDEFLKNREVEVVDTRIEEIKENLAESIELQDEIREKTIEKLEEIKLEPNIEIKEKIDEVILESKEKKEEEPINIVEDRDSVSSDQIINNVNAIEDGFVTYKVYKIKENETLESIVIKYKTTIDELKEYNDINNLSINDKIIIPTYE